MTNQPVLKDEYRLNARLRPAFILLLPAAIALGLAIVSFSRGWALLLRTASGTILAVATNIGLMIALEQFVRGEGKRKEVDLWAGWDGPPTTRMLRHRETELSTPVQRRRLHDKLKELLPTVQLPTKAKENKDPKAADDVYEECVRYLRVATRDEKKFPLILKENIQYGFARNVWALRSIGVTAAGASTIFTAWLTWSAWVRDDSLWVVDGIGVALEVMLFAWWAFKVTPDWVFVPARAYADRLFEACGSLKAEKVARTSAAKAK